MKGTLFSADFIEDSNNNLRLLELNTDTAVSDSGLSHIDFSGFINLLSESSITEVHTISKIWHSNLVSALSQSLSQNAPFITSFTNTLENDTTIYPTTVEDSATKFVLRMAYDESAVFDSEYCKNKVSPFNLFTDSGDSGSVAEYYISSSTDGVSDFLPNDFNASNIPDIVVKDLNIVHNPLSFYKIGKSSETAENRYSEVKSSFGEDQLLIKFYENSSDTSVKSIRSVNIIYGPHLNILNLGNYIGEGLFSKPTSIEFDDTQILNKTDIKHYYELTTSYPKFATSDSWGGIFEEEQVLKTDGTAILIGSASEGTELKSYFIEGAPDTDVVSEFLDWSYAGSEFPSGSYETSSVVVNNIEQPLSYNTVFHVTMEDGSDFRASGGAHLLIYDIDQDQLRYEAVSELDTTSHKLMTLSSGPATMASVVGEILDGDYKTYIIDMESTDTYFLYNGELSVKIVTHNCFPAGTKITLSDGSEKNIEDLTIEDKVLTYNEKTGELTEGRIGNIVKKSKDSLIELTTNDGKSVKTTPLHKFYVKEKGWVAAKDLSEGDVLIKKGDVEVILSGKVDIIGKVDVYHIIDVRDNHTYFAEDLLVHNLKYVFCFTGETLVTMADGSIKKISDVIVGDSVLTYNEATKERESGVVGELKQHEVDSIVRLTFDNGTVSNTTAEHPFYVQDNGWVNASELSVGDKCLKVDGVDAVVESVETINETHTVYNLLSVSDNHNFYANGILVHNKY